MSTASTSPVGDTARQADRLPCAVCCGTSSPDAPAETTSFTGTADDGGPLRLDVCANCLQHLARWGRLHGRPVASPPVAARSVCGART